MKHVFWAHSHITFLLIEKIIDYLNLDKNDIIVILYRNYKLPRKSFSSEVYDFTNFQANKRKDRAELSAFLKQKLNFDFELYVPQSRAKIIDYLINYPLCKSYNYIEEGALVYNYKDKWSTLFFIKLRRFFGVNRRMLMLDYTHKKFKLAYGVTEKAFGEIDKKVILPFNTIKNINQFPKELIEPSSIIVFDAHVYHGMLSLEDSLICLQLMIDHLKKRKVAKAYFKLHPEHNRLENIKERDSINSIFNSCKGIEFVELEESFILEELLFINKNVTIYNFISSVGLYANLLGCKVVSVSNRINNGLNTKIIKDWEQI